MKQIIVKGLYAEPQGITSMVHTNSGRVSIHYSRCGSNEKYFATEESYTADEFKALTIRIAAISKGPNPPVMPYVELNPKRRFFNPSNVKVHTRKTA